MGAETFPFIPVTHVDILFPKGMRTSIVSSLTCLKHGIREIWAEGMVKAMESELREFSTTYQLTSGNVFKLCEPQFPHCKWE